MARVLQASWIFVIFGLLVNNFQRCCGMNGYELEEFNNYLLQTSIIDWPKKGSNHFFSISEDDEDDVPPSLDAWELSGRFEGDILLNDQQRKQIVHDVSDGLSRNGLMDHTKRWPNNELVYYIHKEHFNSAQVQAIEEGIEDLARSSCVKFRPYKKGDRDAVVVTGSRRGCFAQVGYQSGYQILNLSQRHPVGRGCFRHGTVVHEFLHALGFYHMHSSPDRDDYIHVLWENIIEQAKHNFRKYSWFSVSDFGVGYDYGSVLHYSARAFSRNGKPTLVPKQHDVNIGQRRGLSEKDVQKLNKMYCDAGSAHAPGSINDIGKFSRDSLFKAVENKPFQGEGLGYYQGQAIIIKPSPTPISPPDTSEIKDSDFLKQINNNMPFDLTAYMGDYKIDSNSKTTSQSRDEDKNDKKESNDIPDVNFFFLNGKIGEEHIKEDGVQSPTGKSFFASDEYSFSTEKSTGANDKYFFSNEFSVPFERLTSQSDKFRPDYDQSVNPGKFTVQRDTQYPFGKYSFKNEKTVYPTNKYSVHTNRPLSLIEKQAVAKDQAELSQDFPFLNSAFPNKKFENLLPELKIPSLSDKLQLDAGRFFLAPNNNGQSVFISGTMYSNDKPMFHQQPINGKVQTTSNPNTQYDNPGATSLYIIPNEKNSNHRPIDESLFSQHQQAVYPNERGLLSDIKLSLLGDKLQLASSNQEGIINKHSNLNSTDLMRMELMKNLNNKPSSTQESFGIPSIVKDWWYRK